MSDRIIKESYWNLWMGEFTENPMPEGCTHDQMWAMYNACKAIKDREYAAEQITWLCEQIDKVTPKHELYSKHLDNPDYASSYKHTTESLRLLNEMLDFWRKEMIR